MRKKLTFACMAAALCVVFLAGVWLAQPAAATGMLADWERTPVWGTATSLALTAQAGQTQSAASARTRVAAIAVHVDAPPPQAWVGVEWVDPFGKWHAVETWPGPLDAEGRAVRWVREEHFGLGPFRWVVYDRQGGTLWGTSAPFYMPTASRDWLEVTVTALPAATATPTAKSKSAAAPKATATPHP